MIELCSEYLSVESPVAVTETSDFGLLRGRSSSIFRQLSYIVWIHTETSSSNINEVIRSVLNFSFYFFTRRFHKYKKAQKEYKTPKSTKKN